MPVNGFWPSDPRPLFHDPFTLQWGYNELILKLKLQSLCSCYCNHSLRRASLFCSAVLHFEFGAWCQHGKHQSFDMAASGYVSPRDVSSTTYSKSLPQQLPKIPLVRNAIMRRGGCFVTHTVSLKRFFFSQTNFSRRIQRFSKATAKQNSS